MLQVSVKSIQMISNCNRKDVIYIMLHICTWLKSSGISQYVFHVVVWASICCCMAMLDFLFMFTVVISIQNPHLRREALQIWKQRSGCCATYKKLINIFECAGYYNYAENVRKTAHVVESETDDSISSDEVIPQPQTYPHIKSPTQPSLPKADLSQFEEYSLIDPAAAQGLPKCKNCHYNLLDDMLLVASGSVVY